MGQGAARLHAGGRGGEIATGSPIRRSGRFVPRPVALGVDRGSAPWQAAEAPGGRARRLRSDPRRRADAARPDHRLQLLDGARGTTSARTYEEAEANAIGTEYVRADLLPAADAAKVRALLEELPRPAHPVLPGPRRDRFAGRSTTVPPSCRPSCGRRSRPRPAAQPTPVIALAVSGMNDVLNSQGYTQAAWWNRIPTAAWLLMGRSPSSATCWSAIGSRGQGGSRCASGPAARRVDRILPHRRHRQPRDPASSA